MLARWRLSQDRPAQSEELQEPDPFPDWLEQQSSNKEMLLLQVTVFQSVRNMDYRPFRRWFWVRVPANPLFDWGWRGFISFVGLLADIISEPRKISIGVLPKTREAKSIPRAASVSRWNSSPLEKCPTSNRPESLSVSSTRKRVRRSRLRRVAPALLVSRRQRDG